MLRRCEGVFQHKLNEVIRQGRKPNLYCKANDYRDNDKEMAYKIAAVKVYIWPEVVVNNSPERTRELEEGVVHGSVRIKKSCMMTQACGVDAMCYTACHTPYNTTQYNTTQQITLYILLWCTTRP